MTSAPADTPRIDRRAATRSRWAATAAFFTNGALAAAMIPHYPQAKAAFGLDPAGFGLLVTVMTLGAACAGPAGAPILRRAGSRATVLWGSLAIAVVLTGAGLALDLGAPSGAGGPWLWAYAAAVFASGLCDAVVDTAQNAQGLRAQHALGRPVLTSMHAGWSLGAAVGAALGAAAVGAGVPAGLHLGLNGAACVLLLALTLPRFLSDTPDHAPATDPLPADHADARAAASDAGPGPESEATPASHRHPWLLLAPIVVISMAGFSVEEFGNSWTSLFLQAERGMDPATAGLGASTLLGAQFLGRLAGDRVLAALGRTRALTGGLAVVLAGLTVTLLVPVPAAMSTGLALAGLGSAVVVPTAFALADEVPGLPAQTGLAVVSWLMRLAGLGLSPLVGLLAGVLPLTAALGAFVVLAALGTVLALTLGAPRPAPDFR